MSEDVKVGMTVAVYYRQGWWPGKVTRVWDQDLINVIVLSDWGAEGLTSVFYHTDDRVNSGDQLVEPLWAFLSEVDENQQQGWAV